MKKSRSTPAVAAALLRALLPAALAHSAPVRAEADATAQCETTAFATLLPRELFRQHPDFTPYAGMTIGEVRLARLNVFDETDPHENHLLFRALNRVHFVTRESALLPQLLFASGEPLTPGLIAESERNLRQNPYLVDARILPYRVCGRRLDLLVVTRDTWSLEVSTNFSHSGGASNTGLSLADTNFLGSGNTVAANFSRTPERDSLDYSVNLNNLFGSRVSAVAHYADNSDGLTRSLAVTQPFYSLESRWSAGASYYQESREDVITAGGATLNSFRHRIEKNEVFGGVSAGLRGRYTQRYYFGFTQENDYFSPTADTQPGLPADRELQYPWLAIERIEDRFAIYRNINYIQRTEDISLGRRYYLRLGYGGKAFGNREPQWRINASYSDAPHLGPRELLLLEAHFDGAWRDGGARFENTVFGASGAYHYLIDDKNRWYARLALDAGSGLAQDNLLSIGGVDDLRGYPLHFQRGDRRYVLNLERRFYSNVHLLNLIRVGAVAFADAGQVWQSSEGDNLRPLYDAGVGLRLSSSKSHTGSVLHLDYAIPLKDRGAVSHYQWLLKLQQSF